MNRETDHRRTSAAPHIGTAEMSLAMWLRNGRAEKKLSLDDVARITKIQTRILERLEAGRLDGLPAEVFVRGFVRSFARCVGLDEAEALRRLAACLKDGAAKVPPVVAARAVAVIDAMGELAPNTRSRTPSAPQILRDEPGLAAGSMEIPTAISDESPTEIAPIEAAPMIEEVAPIESAALAEVLEASDGVVVAPPPAAIDLSAEHAIPAIPGPIDAAPSVATKKKRTRKATTTASPDGAPKRTRRSKVATGTPSEPTPVVADSEAIAVAIEADASAEAPKRRRKPRGSVQPPIVESVTSVDTSAPLDTSSVDTSAPLDTSSVDASAPLDTTADVTLDAAAEPVVQRSIFDIGHVFGEPHHVELDDAPALETRSVHSGDIDHVVGEINGAVEERLYIEAASSVEINDIETSPFERVEEDAPVQLAWTPRMPPFAISAPRDVVWRKSPAPALVAVIDDADPEGAERVLEDRRAGERRRTFLPPILLDRDGDRSGRQGGLTLAVIILLIAATLTLSYLMRRPSSSGDGVTLDDTGEPSTSSSVG